MNEWTKIKNAKSDKLDPYQVTFELKAADLFRFAFLIDALAHSGIEAEDWWSQLITAAMGGPDSLEEFIILTEAGLPQM